MNDDQLLRYSRHLLLDAIGVEGQERLLRAHALVIGAGGLGSPVTLYLASAGVGRLTIVDDDVVDQTNLQRQIMHTQDRIGQPKVDSARQAVHAINPDVQVSALAERVDEVRLQQLVADADVVLDCCDNFATRHAVNRACVQQRKPLVSGAAIGFDGQVSTYDLRRADSPCYACLFPPSQQAPEVRCATMGVFAPIVGLVGTMQASEALKVLTGAGRTLQGRLLLIDALRSEWSPIGMARSSTCEVCGSGAEPSA